ncbi:MAG: tetratricopeptide repeat protein [Oricola sp.]
MKRVRVFRGLSLRGVAAISAAMLMQAVPAVADSSYMNAFESRVSEIGNRGALETFVLEAVKQGQYDQALSTLEEILMRNPNDLGARIAMARIYYQIGSYDIAAAHLEEAMLTPGWEGFSEQIDGLKAKVDRGQKGIEIRMAVSAGVEYQRETQDVALILLHDEKELVSPYGEIEGVITRDLGTASRDEISVGGSIRYARDFVDLNFNGILEPIDVTGGRFDITYSKGLPDIIDTLRLDVSGYGLIQGYGGGRQLEDYGVETALTVQPTVESRIRTFASYGWLGNSQGLYGNSRVRGGVEGNLRLVAGLAVGTRFSAYSEWGTAPLAFPDGSFDYNAHGWDAAASVSHLLHVFADGRSWTHEAGARYSQERILDYSSLVGMAAAGDMINRDAWEVFWNHSVQIATRAEFNFGVSYGREKITDSGIFSYDRNNESWGVKAGLTYRYN